MAKLTKRQAMEAIRSAGARNDQQAFLRLYTENRISLSVAREEFAAGRRFASAIETRDNETTQTPNSI